MTYVVSLLQSLNISDKELAYADPSFSSTPGLNSSKLGFSLCKISPRISYFGYVFKIHSRIFWCFLGNRGPPYAQRRPGWVCMGDASWSREWKLVKSV